jgi:hypothetical protein
MPNGPRVRLVIGNAIRTRGPEFDYLPYLPIFEHLFDELRRQGRSHRLYLVAVAFWCQHDALLSHAAPLIINLGRCKLQSGFGPTQTYANCLTRR